MSAPSFPDLLISYRSLLSAMEGQRVRRLGPHELFRITEVVQAAEAAGWEQEELAESLASALAVTKDDWDTLYHVCLRELKADPKAQTERTDEAQKQQAATRSAARRRQAWQWLRKYWAAPLLVVWALAWIETEASFAKRPRPKPEQALCLPKPRKVEQPKPQSQYQKICQEQPPVVRKELIRPPLRLPTGLGVLRQTLPGLLLGLLGGGLLLLWRHFLRVGREDDLRRTAEELRQQAERAEQEQKALEELRRLEADAKKQNLPMQSPYRMKLDVPLRTEDLEDCATELGRVYEQRKGSALHVERTLQGTLRAGGSPTPEYQPRKVQREIVVLLEIEQSRPYLPGLEQVLGKLHKLGVPIVIYRFALAPSDLSGERGGAAKLEEVLRRHEQAAVVLCGKLQTRGLGKGKAVLPWVQRIQELPAKAWLDPDPQPPQNRPRTQRDEELSLQRVRRFPLTGKGLIELGRYLQGEVGESRKLVDWEPPAASEEVKRAVKLWLAIGSQVPDASWEQFEAVRQRFFKKTLPDARSVGLLVAEFRSLLGRRFVTTSKTIELDPDEQVPAVAFLKKEAPELYLEGLALFDAALGSAPPGGEKTQGTLRHAERMGRKKRLEELRLVHEGRKEEAKECLSSLLGTAADERAAATMTLLKGMAESSGEWQPTRRAERQLLRLTMQSAAVAAAVVACGAGPWLVAKRSAAVEAALRPLARAVKVTREPEPKCWIDPLPTVVVPTVALNLPLASVRLACDIGSSGGLCDAALSAASTVAGRRYSLVESAKLEALFAREPSLRGCRNDSCRMAIAEQLNLWRLIDVIVHSPRQKKLVASVSIFDPSARGIAAEVERESKRDQAKLAGTVSDAVEQVIDTQRLTARLRIDVRTPNAKVKIIDSRGSVRELSEPECSGKTPVRLFLGGYTVHAEKPGFMAQDLPVMLTGTGTSIQVELQLRAISVRFEWEPKDAIVRVDNRPVSEQYPMMELSEGPHRVEVLAPPGQPYKSTVRDIEVRRDMEPVRLLLQRLNTLGAEVPRGEPK